MAFYKGIVPNIMLVSNPVINYVIYENIKKRGLQGDYQMNFA
jgi:hypothetical protein